MPRLREGERESGGDWTIQSVAFHYTSAVTVVASYPCASVHVPSCSSSKLLEKLTFHPYVLNGTGLAPFLSTIVNYPRGAVIDQSRLTDARCGAVIRSLVSRVPGRFSSELGLNLPARRQNDLFLWFLAAILYGARISGSIVAKTHAEFVRRGLTTPERVVKSGWDGVVEALDAGGYVRYDFKTATKLMEVMTHLIDEYGGDLETLHDAARDGGDLESRLKALGKGIGEVTVQIFLRELRGVWPKAQPALSPLSLLAARDLALISTDGRGADRSIVDRLASLWKRAGVKGKGFSDFESGLVRLGRDYCRRERTQDCPMREFCA